MKKFKFISILLIVVMLFSSVPSFASDEIDPLQKFFVYSISLSNDNRVILADTLKEISSINDVTTARKNAVSAIITDMTADEVAEVLEIYSHRSVKNQESICDIILFGVRQIPYIENMPTIRVLFNQLIIGNPDDNRGIDYFYTLLAIYSMYTLFGGNPYVAKNHELPGLIDLYLPEDMPAEAVTNITGALKFMPALESVISSSYGLNLTEKLFSYAEEMVNTCPSHEIYSFKCALEKLYVFEGSVAPSQNLKYDGITFRDLDNHAWATHQIRVLCDSGVINGINTYVFAPSQPVTREQFVKMLVEAFDITENEDNITAFTDVSADAWYYPYIKAAASAGIVNGLSETHFGVGQPITREQMATMVYRTCSSIGIAMDTAAFEFADSSEISSWASTAVSAMAANGIINGMGNNLFAPKNNAERAQAAVLIYNVMKFASLL